MTYSKEELSKKKERRAKIEERRAWVAQELSKITIYEPSVLQQFKDMCVVLNTDHTQGLKIAVAHWEHCQKMMRLEATKDKGGLEEEEEVRVVKS